MDGMPFELVETAPVVRERRAEVFKAACEVMLDRYLEMREPGLISASLGFLLREAVWAELVSAATGRIVGQGGDGETPDYWPRSWRRVEYGPRGTAEIADAIRDAAWEEAERLEMTGLLVRKD